MNKTASTPPERAPDMAVMEADYRDGGSTKRTAEGNGLRLDASIRGNEQSLVRAFMHACKAGHMDERLPWLTVDCKIVSEYKFKYGRADVVAFHTNGAATVIEAKDGGTGYTAVISGIGQCGLYASQLMGMKTVRRVHRALAFSSTGDFRLDMLIEDACFDAGVIPLPYPSSNLLEQVFSAVKANITERANGCT